MQNYRHYLIRTISFLVICLLSLTGCISAEPQPSINPSELLIDLSDMPADWYALSGNEPSDNYGQEAGAEIWFNVNNPNVLHVAAHRVYEYRNERRAEREFERLLSDEFNSSSIASRTPWQTPAELPYSSLVADQYHFACHVSQINQVVTICEALGKYKNYLVIFHTHIVSEYMTYDDLESILLTIDDTMEDYLSSNES
jgi:hypothetical protein